MKKNKTMRSAIVVCLLSTLTWQLPAQSTMIQEDNYSKKVYHVNRWVSGGIILSGVYTNQIARDKLHKKPTITEDNINRIMSLGVNRFDRAALRQDVMKREDAAKFSDVLLLSSSAAPLLLFLDKDIRQSWLDIGMLYAETQIINLNFYAWSPIGPSFVERYRPVVYYNVLPVEERNYSSLRNSFFSGHTSSTAAATFFMAKVYNDYHPDLGRKKYMIYGLAAIPPTVMGIYRIKALRHFPSDVIVGGLVGAGVGILVPELHRRWQNKLNVSAIYTNNVKGIGLNYRF